MKIKRKIKIELDQKEYRSFIKKIMEENQKKRKMPKYVEYNDIKIYKDEYIETIENVNKFILENGRQPVRITFYYKERH